MFRLLAVASLVLVPGLASAATLYVGPTETYTTIQSAIDAANNGDAINIDGGTYNEQLVIDAAALTNLTIQGVAGQTVIVNAPNSKINAVIATDVNLRLRNLTIKAPNHQNPDDNGIKFISDFGNGSSFTLTACNVSVTDKSGSGNYAFLGVPTGSDVVTVRGSGVTTAQTFVGAVSPAFNFTGGWDDGMDCLF